MRTKDQGADGGRRAIRSGGGWRGLDGGLRSGRRGSRARDLTPAPLGGCAKIRLKAKRGQQPLKEMNSPRLKGSFGVKGSKANDLETSKPAALAALMSTK